MTVKPTLYLGCIVDPYGNHPAAWLTSDARPEAATDLSSYLAIARTAEQHGFDFLFVPDSPAMPEGPLSYTSRSSRSANRLEPITLLAALCASTSHIGFIATVSTSYSEPFTVARQFASLDHLSGGRIGWNVVTTENGSAWENYGGDGVLDHHQRYERAAEYVSVVRQLWDSWDDDAVRFDQHDSYYFDPAKVRSINHAGPWFSVKGPLNISRPPQGHPLIVQAGGSEDGRELAARFADVVFTVQPNLASARDFYTDIKRRAIAHGRSPDAIKVMLGTTVVVGLDVQDAQNKLLSLGQLIHEELGRAMVERILDIDLSAIPYDAVIPVDLLPETSLRNTTYFQAVGDVIRTQNLTLRQLSARLSASRIGNAFKGAPEQIVDEMENWIGSACDGFMIRPTHFPTALNEFCESVLPHLRARGWLNPDRPKSTLRASLGLPHPSLRPDEGQA